MGGSNHPESGEPPRPHSAPSTPESSAAPPPPPAGTGERVKVVPPPPGFSKGGDTKTPGASQAKAENRAYERRPLIREAVATEVLPNGSIGASWTCRTVDLSRGGVGLASRRLLQRGTTIFVRIGKGDGTFSDPYYGVVAHMAYMADGLHHLGIAFRTPPARRTVQEWMAANRGG